MTTPLESRKLGDPKVAKVILGQSPPSSAYNDSGNGLPFFQGKADFGLLYPTPKMWCDAGQKFAEPGDVLLSVRAPVGDINIATVKSVIGRGLAAIRAGAETDSWFLYFALLYSKPNLEARATGSTFASVNKRTLHELEIPFYELAEQAKIGVILRMLIEKLEQETQTVSIAAELKRAAMRELFTRGLRGEPQKETEIGPVPESWELVDLGGLCLATDQVDLASEGDRIIQYIDVSSVSRESLKVETTTEYRLKDAPGRARKRVKSGDVIFATIRPTLLRAARIDETLDNQVCSTAFCVLRTADPELLGKYVFYAVQRPEFLELLARIETGASYPAVTDRQVKAQPIPLPPSDEQRDIVAILDAIDRKIELHRRKRAVLEELFKALLHKLMTGEIRVADLDLSALEQASDPIPRTAETGV